MALAEARAAWQRTANRCLVQEDAKRAPKLACCSSMPPSTTKPVDTAQPTSSDIGHDIPSSTGSWPLNRPPSDSNLSPNSKWWLQLQPSYGYQKCMIDEPVNVETGSINEEKKHKEEEVKPFYDFVGLRDEVSKNGKNELCFDSEKSNTLWWRTADTEELAFLVSQRSLDDIENCDLPRPQNTRFKNDRFSAHVYKPGRLAVESDCPQLISCPEKRLRDRDRDRDDSHFKERMHAFEKDYTTKGQLLEALRHSQTRAREAETAAKQACVEKEHVLKLVFRQASQLFAYKQWLQLVQLENMYFQLKNNKSSTVFPIILPWTPQRSRKTRKSWHKSCSRKRGAKRSCSGYDVGKYAVIFALGLGLVGAGLLLGWTIGWML